MIATVDPKLLQQAIDLHQQNKFSEASEMYRSILETAPDHALTCRLLGTLLFQEGNHPAAGELLKKSLQSNPHDAETWNILGLLYQSTGHTEEALTFYQNALKLEPSNVSILTNHGILLSSMNNLEAGYDSLSKAYAVDPTSVEALYNVALCLQQMGKLPEAKQHYELLLKSEPFHVTAHINVGVIYRKLKLSDQAERSFLQALALDPDSVDAAYNIASLWSEQKREAEAERLLLDITKKRPDYFEAWNDLGELAFQRLELHKARQYFEQASRIAPERWESSFNQGLVYQELGEFAKAKSYLLKSLTYAPDNHLVHFALSEVLMALGEFEQGWKEYEFRLQFELFKDRKYPIPRWRGEPLTGKRIFVFEEQGSGDTFQFFRYLKALKDAGASVIFEGKPQHQRLLSSHPFIDSYVPDDSAAKAGKVDFYSPLLSIPGILYASAGTLATHVPYLTTDESIAAQWSKKIESDQKLKIGLFWCGNTFSNINKKRHCALSDLAPLFEIPEAKFFSIQVGDPAQELHGFEKNKSIEDLGSQIGDFADTAAIISRLDLVITIDSSVAHLAGALGKKTFLLVAKTPDWRWIQDSSNSVWYPTVTLFRQIEHGDWAPCIAEIKTALSRAAAQLTTSPRTLIFALTSGENFGWGVCSKYLTKETQKRRELLSIGGDTPDSLPENATIFHALRGADLKTLSQCRGKINVGYTFFENELNDDSVTEGRKLDFIFGGSTWNKIKLEEKGLKPAGVLIQGIDPEIFYPRGDLQKDSLFTIFSGGKLEIRKGQDLVIRAVAIMQQKYKDVILVNAWYNLWQHTMLSLGFSKHIKFSPRGERWQEFVMNLCQDNGLDISRVLSLPLTKNELFPDIYAKTDIGLFPNRGEGGTNLVLMEYMASGKPVIASYNTGHTDVLTDRNSFPLREQKPYPVYNEGILVADWAESSLDEIVAKLEWAYHHRDEIKAVGKNAGEDMKQFTWGKSAESLLNDLQKLGYL
jgi:tetratricopeptide (TPR) repeat protein/glycosyltransferase involved in cell wall biosynthesis